MNRFASIRAQVMAYSQKLVHEGYLKGTGGNVSLRVPGEPILAITPSNRNYLLLCPEDICVYSFEKEKIEGDLKPSIEMGFHIAVYQNRPDVGCVIHTHQDLASALAVLAKPVPALFDEQVRFLGRSVEVIPYAPSGTGLLVKRIKKVVSNRHNAYIMKNHGVLCMGPDAERAYHNVLLLEKAAGAYLMALCSGEKVNKIPLAIREIAFHKLRSEQAKIDKHLSDLVEQDG